MNCSKDHFVTTNLRVPKSNPLYLTDASWSLNVGLLGIGGLNKRQVYSTFIYLFLQAFQGKNKKENKITENIHWQKEALTLKLFGNREMQKIDRRKSEILQSDTRRNSAAVTKPDGGERHNPGESGANM